MASGGRRLSGGQPAEWSPDFEGQRPPFAPANELAVQHGAYSPRKVDPLAEELVTATLQDVTLGFLAAPAYRPAVWAWARAEAQVQLLTEYLAARLDAEGMPDLDDSRTVAAYRELHRAETRAESGRKRLGLDPLSRARLGKDVATGQAAALDVATVMARLAELEAQGVQVPGQDRGPTDD